MLLLTESGYGKPDRSGPRCHERARLRRRELACSELKYRALAKFSSSILVAQDGPVHAGPALVAGQQRTVHVEGPERHQAQDPFRDEGAVVEREDQVGRERADTFLLRPVRKGRSEDDEAAGPGEVGDGVEPALLLGVVLMGIDLI